MGLLTKEFETAPCVVEVSHRFDSLHAHVKFLNGAVINPGDEVQVQGPPVMAPYGEVVREERTARISRASKLEQLWTRMTGDFEFMELCEFSFSEDVDADDAPGNEPAPQVAQSAVGEKGTPQVAQSAVGEKGVTA